MPHFGDHCTKEGIPGVRNQVPSQEDEGKSEGGETGWDNVGWEFAGQGDSGVRRVLGEMGASRE